MVGKFDSRSDHDLLVVAVTDLKHIKNHMKDLADETKIQNGRIRVLEGWQVRMGVVLALIGAGWPLLIYEVRQFLLEKFGFIP